MPRRERQVSIHLTAAKFNIRQVGMKHVGYRIEEPKRSVGFHGSIDVLTPHIDNIREKYIAVISDRNDFISDMNEWAEAINVAAIQRRNLLDLLEDDEVVSPGLVVVDMKPHVDIAPMLETLLEFRMIRPEVAVVLISEEVNRHDFGTDRLRICDITLKGPVDGAILSLGISEAFSNNVKWGEKLSSQRKESLGLQRQEQ